MTTGRGLLRRQRAAYLALALLIAVGGGVAIGASIAAYRTDRAYPEFVKRSKIADLVINPSISTLASEPTILRVLGFSDAQLRASVRWQAGATMIIGVAIGSPFHR